MNSKIFRKLVEILTDNADISNENQRRAYYSQIFAGEQNRPDIDFSGAPREGNRIFIDRLQRHTLSSGENALSALLRLVRDEVGVDVAKSINDLLAEIAQPIDLHESNVPQTIFIGFGPDDAELGQQIVNELSEIYDDVDVVPKEEMEWDGNESIYCAVIIFSSTSKALANKEAKKLIKGEKRIIRVLTSDFDEASPPIHLSGVPTVRFDDFAHSLVILKQTIQETIDIVRGLERDSWELLINKIREGECVPIIGPDMCRDPIISENTLADEWSKAHGYGLRGDVEIARIAQYLGYIQPNGFSVKSELTIKRLLNTHPDFLNDEHNHYRILSRLPFSIFITTSSDAFLFEALKEEKKLPQEWHFWNEEWINEHRDEVETAFNNLTDKEPAIVYLFGHYSHPESMRVSEDDFLDYVFHIGRNASLFPTWLPRILRNKMLLILGFQLHDWRFRTITHAFSEYFNSTDDSLSHLAVQIPPIKDDPSPDDEKNVNTYLERYLNKMNSRVFIGDPVDFIGQLRQKWDSYPS
jgi:hypothetical protein